MTRRRLAPTALLSWIGQHKALVAFCALVGAYYLWTVWSTASPFDFNENRDDYYNLLSDGFLGGHLHLLISPSPDLLALPNPYDPTANQGLRVHDLSLYHDQYYVYWGPSPALLLYMPFRLLPLGDMPETLAAFIFAFTGFCFSIASLRLLARRFVPEAPRWMLGAAAVALAAGNALPFTLRRVGIYETAITAGFCLSFIALYLVITGLQNGVRPRRLILASLLVGLAVGARPTMIVWGLGLVVLAVILARRTPERRAQLRIVGMLLGPLVAVGVLLVLYNQLRFGSPAEFGQKYQLAGYDPATKEGNKLSYLPPGLWYYLLARPHLTLGFPFFHLAPPPLSYPFETPLEYTGLEAVGGMVTTVPFIALALALPFALRGTARRVTLALLGIGLLIMALVSFALWGATMRYEVDFASILIIAAALGWMALAVRVSGLKRRAVAIGGGVLIAWGVLVGAAVGFSGYYNGLRSFSPKTFHRLQVLTSPLPTAISYLDGKPKTTDFAAPLGVEVDTDPNPGIGALTFVAGRFPAELTVVSGSPRRYGLRFSTDPPPTVPDTVVKIETPDTHRSFELRGRTATTVYPISLRRGINRIQFRVSRPANGLMRLMDVEIVPLP